MANRLTKQQIEEIKRLYLDDKLTQSEIAVRIGCSQPAVRKQLVKARIKTRNKWAKGTRVCRGRCGKELPLSAFWKKDYVCKKCKPEYNRQKGHEMDRVYGIDRQEYETMLAAQNFRCSICGKTQDENGRELAIDHDHENGDVRALLCSNCNTRLSAIEDKDFLVKALTYLNKFKVQ